MNNRLRKLAKVVMVLIFILIISRIIYVNVKSGNNTRQLYAMNEKVSSGSYTYEILNCYVEEYEDTINRYEDVKALLVVKCRISAEETSNIPWGNMMAQLKGCWSNSVDPMIFLDMNEELINSGWNRKIDSNPVEIILPYTISDIQVSDYSFDKFTGRDYEFVFSFNPFQAIRMTLTDR